MPRKLSSKAVLLIVVIALFLSAAGCGCERRIFQRAQSDNPLSIESGGMTRTYVLHVPKSIDGTRPVPLVLAFHGHGGRGKGQERLSHLSEVADRHGFIVAFPDGVNRGWNDGRLGSNQNTDDVGFTRDLVKKLEAQYKIDKKRIYATGISNGGFMCYRLACELSAEIAAIAPVAAPMGETLSREAKPSQPVSLALFEGTKDPFIHWDGGPVAGGFGGRGNALSTADTIAYWVKQDGCSTTPATEALPDNDSADGCNVRREMYSGGRDGTAVVLYAIDEGGHTWPGGWQYLPVRIIGPTNRDIDASEVMWDFFEEHPKQG